MYINAKEVISEFSAARRRHIKVRVAELTAAEMTRKGKCISTSQSPLARKAGEGGARPPKLQRRRMGG
jgi:hypothetical protein